MRLYNHERISYISVIDENPRDEALRHAGAAGVTGRGRRRKGEICPKILDCAALLFQGSLVAHSRCQLLEQRILKKQKDIKSGQ